MIDYGPLHNYWCFPFERYNGLLGKLPNNNRSIEAQVMNRFIKGNVHSLLEMCHDKFAHLFPHDNAKGSLLDESYNSLDGDVHLQILPASFLAKK